MIYKIWFTLLITSLGINLHAQEYNDRTVYRDSYATSTSMRLEVNNKYGDIQVLNWDKDSIQITTEVYLSSSSPKKMNKLKKSINIKYNNTAHYVVATTSFDSNSVQLINELKSFTKDMMPSTAKTIEINYKIYAPQNISLKINNQYGDIYLEDIDNDVEISLSNGSFKANELRGSTLFDFHFVDAAIKKINDGDIQLAYSQLEIAKAINIESDSKSSEIKINDANVLKLKSNRDEITLSTIDYLYGTSNYSDLKVERIIKEIDCEMKYGEIIVNNISDNCSTIDIFSERTDIELFIPKKRAFEYDIMYNESCNLQLPIKTTSTLTSYNGEAMYSRKGSTENNSQLSIKIKAIKRSLIKLQYLL